MQQQSETGDDEDDREYTEEKHIKHSNMMRNV